MTDNANINTFTLDAVSGQIGVLELNRAQDLNALSSEMVTCVYNKLCEWSNDDNINMVLVKAVRGRSFCVGGDVVELYNKKEQGIHKLEEAFATEYKLTHLIQNYSKPYVSIMDGITMGGGSALSMHGTYKIATENFNFAMPESKIGCFPDVGGSYILSRGDTAIGMYLALTGNMLTAHPALNLGYIDFIINSLDQKELIDSFLKIEDFSNESIKEVISNISINEKVDSLSQETKDFIRSVFSAGSLQEIIERLKEDKNDISEDILAIMYENNPLSLIVIFEFLIKAKDLSFTQCLQKEYDLTCKFLRSTDLFEGIRAKFIDKDNSPNWQYKTIDDVPEEIYTYYLGSCDFTLRLNT